MTGLKRGAGQLLVSRITGNLGTGTNLSGNRVCQELSYPAVIHGRSLHFPEPKSYTGMCICSGNIRFLVSALREFP